MTAESTLNMNNVVFHKESTQVSQVKILNFLIPTGENNLLK